VGRPRPVVSSAAHEVCCSPTLPPLVRFSFHLFFAVNASGLPSVEDASLAIAGPAQETRSLSRDSFSEFVMTRSKNILLAAFLSSGAAVSFAQTPATPKPAMTSPTNPTAATAPADTASAVKKHHRHHHHRHHSKKAAGVTPAASAAK
jgi:hypothetical protein